MDTDIYDIQFTCKQCKNVCVFDYSMVTLKRQSIKTCQTCNDIITKLKAIYTNSCDKKRKFVQYQINKDGIKKPTKIHKVSIIGCAGRGSQYTALSTQKFNTMCNKTLEILQMNFNLELGSEGNIHLISGGAAWSDHVAVKLFLDKKVAALTLELPCKWDSKKHMYVDNKSDDWKKNPGRSANKYHKTFSVIRNINSLIDIKHAFENGAKCNVWEGFHDRNKRVANTDYMIAFTLSNSDSPMNGSGTHHTWKLCNVTAEHKVHIPILSL